MSELTDTQIGLLSAFRKDAERWATSGNAIVEVQGKNTLYLLDVIEQLSPGGTTQTPEEFEERFWQRLGRSPPPREVLD